VYKLINFAPEYPTVLRIADNTCIPFDPANTDYQQYLAWLSEGNEPLPADTTETE